MMMLAWQPVTTSERPTRSRGRTKKLMDERKCWPGPFGTVLIAKGIQIRFLLIIHLGSPTRLYPSFAKPKEELILPEFTFIEFSISVAL